MEELYLKQIEDYCNVTFDEEDLPAGIELAVKELIKVDPMSFNVTSEKISDLSQTFNNNGDIPPYIKMWLNPYRRSHLIGNKNKRPYISGRND